MFLKKKAGVISAISNALEISLLMEVVYISAGDSKIKTLFCQPGQKKMLMEKVKNFENIA